MIPVLLVSTVSCSTQIRKADPVPLCEQPVREDNTGRGWVQWGLDQEKALKDCNAEILRSNAGNT